MLHTDLSSSTLESARSGESETDPAHSHETLPSKTESLSAHVQTKPTSDSHRDPSKRESADAVTKKSAGKSVRWQDIVQNESMEAEDEEETSSDDSEEYVELCRPTTINFIHTPLTNVVQVCADVVLYKRYINSVLYRTGRRAVPFAKLVRQPWE